MVGELKRVGGLRGGGVGGGGGMLRILETALGLGGPEVPDSFRVADLIAAFRREEGFWSRFPSRTPPLVRRRESTFCGIYL